MNEIKKKIQLCVIAKNNGNYKALLLKTNVSRGSFWQNITGGVDQGEKYINAALREFEEESGQNLKNFEYELISLEMKFSFMRKDKKIKEKVFALICHETFDVIIDSKEHQEYKWIELNRIQEKDLKFKSNFTPLKKCQNILF